GPVPPLRSPHRSAPRQGRKNVPSIPPADAPGQIVCGCGTAPDAAWTPVVLRRGGGAIRKSLENHGAPPPITRQPDFQRSKRTGKEGVKPRSRPIRDHARPQNQPPIPP